MGNQYYKVLAVKKETFELVMTRCVEDFLNNHPEFKGYQITQDFIIQKIADFYLQN